MRILPATRRLPGVCGDNRPAGGGFRKRPTPDGLWFLPARRSGVPIDPLRTLPVPQVDRLVMPANAIPKDSVSRYGSPQHGSPRNLPRYLDAGQAVSASRFVEWESSVGSENALRGFSGNIPLTTVLLGPTDPIFV